MSSIKKTESAAEAETSAPVALNETELGQIIAKGISDGLVMAELSRQAATAKSAPPPKPDFNVQCDKCGQKAMACKGRHAEMVVFPKDPDLQPWFKGCRINGTNYLSDHDSHFITVPSDAPIAHMVQQWEGNERQLRAGRKANHNSGTFGNFRPATSGWR